MSTTRPARARSADRRSRSRAAVPEGGRFRIRLLLGRIAASTTGTSRVWALTIVLTAFAAVLAALEVPAREAARPPLLVPWWAIAILFYATEAKVVHLHIGLLYAAYHVLADIARHRHYMCLHIKPEARHTHRAAYPFLSVNSERARDYM